MGMEERRKEREREGERERERVIRGTQALKDLTHSVYTCHSGGRAVFLAFLAVFAVAEWIVLRVVHSKRQALVMNELVIPIPSPPCLFHRLYHFIPYPMPELYVPTGLEK